MTQTNKNKLKASNKLLKISILLLLVVVLVETFILLKLTNNNEEGNAVVINKIETPMANFIYGYDEVDSLKANINLEKPYDVTFLADLDDKKNIEVLKFFFDESGKGVSIGIINGNNEKEVKVSVEKNGFDQSLELTTVEKDMLLSIQEELLDTIVSNFDVVEYTSEDTRLAEENILVETPFVKIPFSKQWEKYLVVETIENESYKVIFSCQIEEDEPVELFTYSFGEDVQEVMGYINQIPVGYTSGTNVAKEDWSLDDKDIFYTMRDEMYRIFEYLITVDGFELVK